MGKEGMIVSSQGKARAACSVRDSRVAGGDGL